MDTRHEMFKRLRGERKAQVKSTFTVYLSAFFDSQVTICTWNLLRPVVQVIQLAFSLLSSVVTSAMAVFAFGITCGAQRLVSACVIQM